VFSPGYDAGPEGLAHGNGAAGTARPRAGSAWRGAGGRWLVWVFRIALWFVLLVIGYRGITAIVFNETPSGSHPAAQAARKTGFPTALAGAFALQFGDVYLNANPATSGQRGTELAAFLPPGADPQLGWNGTGTLQLQSEQIAGVRSAGPHHGVVTLLARVDGRLMELAVPIYATGGRLVVSGEPALLPPPRRAVLPSVAPVTSDPVVQAALTAQLADFFRAYASGNADTLARFVVPGTSVTGLGGEVVFGSLTNVTVPQGGVTRRVIATVMWRIGGDTAGGGTAAGSQPAAGFEMSYALTVTKRTGTWYVKNIGPASQPGGSP
jgi:hypothetical protein